MLKSGSEATENLSMRHILIHKVLARFDHNYRAVGDKPVSSYPDYYIIR